MAKNHNFKKYIVMGWNQFYPWGGMNDVVDSFGTKTHARDFIRKNERNLDHYQLIDRDTLQLLPLSSEL